MIGIFEIIFCLVAFIIMWFLIFNVMLKNDNKKSIKNLASNIEKQEGREFLVEGKRVCFGKRKPETPGEKVETKTPEEKGKGIFSNLWGKKAEAPEEKVKTKTPGKKKVIKKAVKKTTKKKK